MVDGEGWRSLRSLATFKIFLSSFHSLRKITKVVEQEFLSDHLFPPLKESGVATHVEWRMERDSNPR
jgi:hypothetical protein